jgi:hypothetical protein
MSIRATIVVSKPPSPAISNPLTHIQQAASQLESCGFTILSVGLCGIRVRADRSLYQTALGLSSPPKHDAALGLDTRYGSTDRVVSSISSARPLPCY